MRLTEEQRNIIKSTLLKHFGKESKFYLFGSRVDDNKRGGDIDLYIEASFSDRRQINDAKINTAVEFIKLLGERKIDIVVHGFGAEMLPIHKVAQYTGVEL